MKIESSVIAMHSTHNYESIEFTKVKSQDTKWVQGTSQDKQDKLDKENGMAKFISETKKLLLDESQTQMTSSKTKAQNQIVNTEQPQECSISPTELEDHQLSLLKLKLQMFSKHN